MDAHIAELTVKCVFRHGASAEALKALSKVVSVELPGDYLELMACTDGLEGFVGSNYLSLWPSEHVRLYGVYDSIPFLLFIGSNGAGEGYAYDTRAKDMPIVNVPFIGMSPAMIRVMGSSLEEFLQRLHCAPLL